MLEQPSDLTFISCHHKDRPWLELLEIHLEPLVQRGALSRWNDAQVQAGDDLAAASARALEQASVLILLVSADYLASPELKRMIRAKENGATLLWLPVRPSAFEETQLAGITPLLDPARALALLGEAEAEAELVQACRHIASVVKTVKVAALHRFATDMNWLQARLQGHAGYPQFLEKELQTALQAGSTDVGTREILEHLERTVRQQARWLHGNPGALPGLLYAYLREAGWGDSRIASTLQVPAGLPSLWRQRFPVRLDWGEERTLWRGDGNLSGFIITHDGKRVVSGSDNGALKIWDLQTGKLEKTLEKTRKGLILAYAVNPAYEYLVIEQRCVGLEIWDLRSGKFDKALRDKGKGSQWRCAVTPDGKHIVSYSDRERLNIWNLMSGKLERTLQEDKGRYARAWTCLVTPDGKRLISSSDNDGLKVWNLQTGQVERTLISVGSFWGWVCAVTPDGKRLIVGTSENTLMIWNLESGELERNQAHARGVTVCAVSPDGKHLVLGFDRKIEIRDLESSQLERVLQGHAHDIYRCALSPDGMRLISESYEGALKVWNLQSDKLKGKAPVDWIQTCAVSPDGRHLISGTQCGLKVLDLKTGNLLRVLGEGWITACAVTSDGKRLVSNSFNNNKLEVWDLQTGRLERTLKGRTQRILTCAISPDGRRLVSGSEDGLIEVWDLQAGQLAQELEGHTETGLPCNVTTCTVSPDGMRLVSGSEDASIMVWDLRTGNVEQVLVHHRDAVLTCVISPDGRRMISGARDHTIHVWDMHSGKVERTLQAHTGSVLACAISLDGKRLFSGSSDCTLKQWDLESGCCLHTVYGVAPFVGVATAQGIGVAACDSLDNCWVFDL